MRRRLISPEVPKGFLSHTAKHEKLLDNGSGTLEYALDKQPMSTLFIRRAFTMLAVLAFLTVSTVALSHSHSVANAASETHCTICMAVHSATHAVAPSVAALYFLPVQIALLLSSKSCVVALVQPCPNQDRAPPEL